MIDERLTVKTVSGLDTSILGARARIPYDQWVESTGLPIYGGHIVRDPMDVELAPWPLFDMDTAFIQLEGMPTVCEGRISEIPPGGSSCALKQAVSEVVYVIDGDGAATVWSGDGARQSVQWRKGSLFLLPRNTMFQLSNSGDRPARLLSYNFRPLGMTSMPEIDLHFNGPWEEPGLIYGSGGDFYAAPTMRDEGATWRGNYFADIGSSDALVPYVANGAVIEVVGIEFPGAGMKCHIARIPPQRYARAEKHGPGHVVILAKGQGLSSVMTPRGWENSEYHIHANKVAGSGVVPAETRVVSPMQEGSFLAVPDNWYHQHFNTGSGEAHFLVLHPLPQFAGNPYRHRMEFADEDPSVREMFESALAERGLSSLMPAHHDAARHQEHDSGGA